MSGRPLAALLLCAGAVAAAVLRGLLATTLVGACAMALLVGFRWRKVMPTMLAGWLLYIPLAAALTTLLPASWSYLASGLFVIACSEGLAFQYDVSAVLESQTGVDAEAKSLASELSRAHRRKVSAYAALSIGVMAASSLVSGVTHYASELIAAAILLVFITAIYATR